MGFGFEIIFLVCNDNFVCFVANHKLGLLWLVNHLMVKLFFACHAT